MIRYQSVLGSDVIVMTVPNWLKISSAPNLTRVLNHGDNGGRVGPV
jgi:hypothetical protein